MDIKELNQKISADKLFTASMDHMDFLVFLLDKQFRIVYLNDYALKKTIFADRGNAIGQGIGDVMVCQNSGVGGKCRESDHCQYCSVKKLIDQAAVSHLVAEGDTGPLSKFTVLNVVSDFREKVVPIQVSDEELYMVTMTDKVVEMEHESLQRLFFHDILNTASGLYNAIRLMKMSYDDLDDDIDLLEDYVKDIIEEINYQRDIFMTEDNQSQIHIEWFSLHEVLKSIIKTYKRNSVFKHLEIRYVGSDIAMVVNDRIVIRRVLINLIKNALEANQDGSPITVNIENGNPYMITVHNVEVIPEVHQEHIFTKGFSTKGKGRGLGIYGAKLLVEKHGIGTLTFKSKPDSGTVFMLEVNKNVEEN